MPSQPEAAAWQTARVDERADLVVDQLTSPDQVSAGLRQELIDCWITVSNAGGAVGFPFPPVDTPTVVPAADQLIAGLNPGRSRLLIAHLPAFSSRAALTSLDAADTALDERAA
jgi:hypothetical protein